MRSLGLLGVLTLFACSTPASPPPADSGGTDTAVNDVAPDAVGVDVAVTDAPRTDAPDAMAVDTVVADAPTADVADADVSGMDLVLPDVPPGAPGADVPPDVRPDVATDAPRDVVCSLPGQTACGGACVSTATDPSNCGGCDTACCVGQVCVSGVCWFVCSAGLTVCGRTGPGCSGSCVNTATDPNHCGACGNACPSGQVCAAGRCSACAGCATGTTCCGSACANTLTDTNHCGGCGNVCPSGQVCNSGVCGCPSGRTNCAGTCVDTSSNNTHCGACGQACCTGNMCTVGSCFPGCAPPMTACPLSLSSCRGGICVNSQTDAANCGGCGIRCATGETCSAGRCQSAGFMALEPCTAASSYVDGSTVQFGGAVGLSYSPRCVTIRVGATLTFQGEFSGHPLDPSTRGTSGNPITRTASGTTRAVAFPTAGFYPYYCAFHGTDSGSGMAGVVQVVP